MKLNPEQDDAVRHIKGPLLIFAGAGSGKTRVITNRIVHLIQNCNVDPKHIVALSFTNKSAREMRERIRKMLNRQKTRGLELSTFHSLGLSICKKYITLQGYKLPFMLQTPSDLELIIVDLLKKWKIDPKAVNPKHVLSKISFLKNTKQSFDPDNGNELEMIVDKIFPDYVNMMKDMNSLDFDDLILKPIELMQEFSEVSQYYRKKFQYFMIDEFQDTNQTQYEFMKALLGENTNLCVVGDDDQSIYGFRGSNRDLILNFEKDFPNTKVIKLLRNYRSSVNILGAANSLIKHNENRREKELWSDIYSDEKVSYIERLDERDEAGFVADKIQEWMIKHKKKGSQFTILFRTNFQSRPFEEELRLRSIPYKLIGAYNFFDRKEVKDILSYIRVIANHKDDLSLLRILNYPKRGLGQNSIFKIQEKATELDESVYDILLRICEQPEFIPVIKKASAANIYELVNLLHKYKKEFYSTNRMSETLRALVKEINFEKEISLEEDDEKVVKARMLNISELINMLSYFESEWEGESKPTLFDFIMRVSLLTSDDENNENKDEQKVQMMTMHLSKGLEFDIVFLVGLEEGVIPTSRSLENSEAVSEERRLMYVGMTRAREKLYLTSAKERKKFGETIPCTVSRFVDEIDKNFLHAQFIDSEFMDEAEDFLSTLEKMKAS